MKLFGRKIKLKKILTLLFAFIVSLIVTSLIIMGDSDIDGIEGLASLNAIITLFLFSFIPFTIICIILFICNEYGTKKGLIALIVFSITTMFILMLASQPNLSFSQKVETMAKSTTFMIFVFAIGAFPYWFTFIKKKRILTN